MAEISTILGLVLALLAVGVGMMLKGASPSVLLNPAAFLIIFGGTIAAIFVAFPMSQVKQLPAILKIAFLGRKFPEKGVLVKQLSGYANLVRREGLLALDAIIDTIDEPFLKKALTLATSTNSSEDLARILESEIEAMKDRHRIGATMFSQAGSYAPSLGVLGAVVGLISALGNLNDIEKLGHSIAAAFVATLLGIFSGYVIWNPLCNKMKVYSKEEAEIMELILTGVISIQRGDHVFYVEQEMLSKMSPAEVRAYEYEKENRDNVEEKGTS